MQKAKIYDGWWQLDKSINDEISQGWYVKLIHSEFFTSTGARSGKILVIFDSIAKQREDKINDII